MGAAGGRPRARRRMFIAAGALILLGALAYGAHWWMKGRFVQTTDDAYVGGDVTVLAPHVPGYIARVLVKDNQHVDAGQLVVLLEDHDYRAAYDAAAANVEERQASLDRLRAQRLLDETLIGEARAALDSRKATARFTAQDARRYQRLAASHAVSIQDMDRSRSESAVAAAAVVAAESSLAAARGRLAVVDAQISEGRAALAKARAEQQAAELKLGYTRLYAPVDGYVGNRSAQEGSYAAAGRKLMSVVPARGLWVDANFKEDQIADMRAGAPARVVADVMPSKAWHGRVASLAPASGAVFSVIPAENATGNFTKIVQRVPVRIELENEAAILDILRPGLSVTVAVDTGS